MWTNASTTTTTMEVDSPPQKYANEIVWYTFYSESEKREYYYEPQTKTATWILLPPRPSHRTVDRPPTKQEEFGALPQKQQQDRPQQHVNEKETQAKCRDLKTHAEQAKEEEEEEFDDDSPPPELTVADLFYIAGVLGYQKLSRILTSPSVATAMLILNMVLLTAIVFSSFRCLQQERQPIQPVEIQSQSVQQLVDAGLF